MLQWPPSDNNYPNTQLSLFCKPINPEKYIEYIKCRVCSIYFQIHFIRLITILMFCMIKDTLLNAVKNWKNPNENKRGKILARSKVLSTLKSFLPQDFTSYIGKPLVGDWLLKVKQGYRSRPPGPHKSSWYFQQEIFS